MSIHIGQMIKEELYAQGVSVSAFAKKINRSRNVVYNIFERESIDTGLLNKIAKVLNCDFFSRYSAQKELSHQNIRHYSEPHNNYHRQSEELALLQQQHETLKQEVAYLKKIVGLLESKADPDRQ
jgi:transcriptional regulator with XRE-family HTH domain